MAIYAVCSSDLISSLQEEVPSAKQVWLADDSGAAANINELKKWWDHLQDIGPKYGYFPKPSKTYLIVKDEEARAKAVEIFGEHENGVKITLDGHRHIGAVIGSENFKTGFVSGKVEK